MLFENDSKHHLLEMPEIECGFDYIIDIFNRTGKMIQNGMGVSPLTWLELKAFNELNGSLLTIWESKIIFEMSIGYCKFYFEGEDHGCLPPYEVEDKEIIEKRRNDIGDAFLSLAERLNGKGKKSKGLGSKRGRK